jgi:hypothetical protein
MFVGSLLQRHGKRTSPERVVTDEDRTLDLISLLDVQPHQFAPLGSAILQGFIQARPFSAKQRTTTEFSKAVYSRTTQDRVAQLKHRVMGTP